MSRLSVAIVGAGQIAGGYDENRQDREVGVYTHAGAYVAHGGFLLNTLFDADGKRAEEFSRIWKVESVVASLTEICGGFHDVISVCTPDHTHFGILRDILDAGCCRTVFVEKPLATELHHIEELIRLAEEKNIRLVVNYQRRNEPLHREIRERIESDPGDLLSVTGCYMKGLRHIGVTMIDTLCYLCGYPQAVLGYNRILNQETDDYSYEFVLFYPGFTVAVKTTDAERFRYNYHIFEIDMLLRDHRLTLADISQGLKESPVTAYAYSGVKVMNERESQYSETGYKTSMLDAVNYIYDITTDKTPHSINTPQSSWNNCHIINRITESYERGLVKLPFDQGLWKR